MGEGIRRELRLPHPPGTVWRALTESAALEDWLMPNDFEPRVGHRFTFRTQPNPRVGFDGLVHCEVLECTPPTRLSYTWVAGPMDSRVTYRLESDGEGTRLIFEHTGFDLSIPGGRQAYRGAQLGWPERLAALERVATRLSRP